MPLDLQHVLGAMLEGIVVVDEWGIVRQMNPEACRILEESADAIRGRPIEDVHGDDHAIARLCRSALDTARATADSDQPIQRRLEADALVDVAASPVFDAEGNVDGVVVSLRDQTVRRGLEADAAERERLEIFGRIAMGLAHEVKNPLGGIRGAGELLLSRASDDRNREVAKLIVREVDRIADLVEDFMTLARGDELRLEPVNLHHLLDEVLDVLTHDSVSRGVEAVRAYDPSIPDLPGDRARLTQVFLNVARNACEAMGPQGGGTLTVSTRMALDQRLVDAGGAPVPTVAVEFLDTGPGISPEVIDKVATPFFTTRKEGTGLGLPLADHWVTRHQGRLRVQSEPAGGARVRVDLPWRRSE